MENGLRACQHGLQAGGMASLLDLGAPPALPADLDKMSAHEYLYDFSPHGGDGLKMTKIYKLWVVQRLCCTWQTMLQVAKPSFYPQRLSL